MSNKLKAITTKAKQLYKTGKFSKWTDAIKQASKMLTKTTVSKKIGAIKKKATKKVVAKKKVATKKKAVKKSPVRNYGSHKDTASHNVKISVMSGIDKNQFINKIKENNNIIEKYKKGIIYCENQIKKPIYNFEKKEYKSVIKQYKELIKEYKLHNLELKKHI